MGGAVRALVIGRGFTAMLVEATGGRGRPGNRDVAGAFGSHLARVGRAHAADLVLDFDLVRPGQAVAILRRPGAALEMAGTLHDAWSPANLRIGIGFGGLDGPSSGPARLVEGPCVDRAQAALAEARRRGDAIVLRGFEPLDGLLSASLSLARHARSSWTPTQERYVSAYEGSWVAVARREGVSPSAVSQAVSRARVEDLREIQREAVRLLDTHWKGPASA